MQPLESEIAPSKTKRLLMWLPYGLIALVVLFGAVCAWQQYRIHTLQKTQLPSKEFSSFSDCMAKGGMPEMTINANLSACLEGGGQVMLQYSAQDLPRIDDRKVTSATNRVDGVSAGSADLVAFLLHDDTGCQANQGYYKILKELPNRFALLNYGCTNDATALSGSYHMVAMKLGDGWSLLSPTGNFNESGVPSCLMVDMFKISKLLTPQCFENTGHGDGTLRSVRYL